MKMAYDGKGKRAWRKPKAGTAISSVNDDGLENVDGDDENDGNREKCDENARRLHGLIILRFLLAYLCLIYSRE
ncbi:hypothetical protein QQ045_029780 [Rhodiola kirilowii]